MLGSLLWRSTEARIRFSSGGIIKVSDRTPTIKAVCKIPFNFSTTCWSPERTTFESTEQIELKSLPNKESIDIRDRQIFFRNSKKFLYSSDSESPESNESTGKKIFRKFEFLTIRKSTFIFLVEIIENHSNWTLTPPGGEFPR